MDVKNIVLKINSETQTKTVVHTEITKYLKAHQIDGIKFIFENCYEQKSGCILAHCMGLGKTLQVIALLSSVISLKEYSTNKVLVLCTVSTIINWKDEIIKWLAPINQDQRKLQIYELEQKDDINRKIAHLQKWSQLGSNDPAGCLIMGYDAFRNLVNFHSTKTNFKKYSQSQLREIRQSIEKYLLKSADIVICDEGHIIKNLNAGITIAVNQIKTGKRIILTGTPMQNHLMEYYSMVNFVKPSFLGTKQHFNEYFAEPIKNGQHTDSCPADIKYMKERSYALNKKLSKIVQRREISLLKDFLPEKFEYVLFVPLTEIQYKLYKYFLHHRGGSIEYKRLFGDYTCLRKIWTHLKVLDNAHQKSIVKKKKSKNCDDESGSDDDESQMGGLDSIDNDWWRKVINKSQLESALSSHKIILLFEILEQCKRVGDKCVVFSSFVEVLNVVEYFMNEINGNRRAGLENVTGPWIKNQDYYRLDGSVPKDRRHSMITNFNNDGNKRIKVLLNSAHAGGQGINLFGANRLILLDTSWNPAIDQQSIFRIYRMGQKKHCYIYRLLSMGTMEEKIYSRSVTKQAMSCRVVDKQQVDRHYSINELDELYSLTKTNMAERPVPILPKDNLLAHLLQKHPDKIYKYLEHDSLLENKVEEELNDAEKNEAWQRFERNSQSQSFYASSVPLQQQILPSSSQNPLAGKSHNKMESNILELKKPVAVHSGKEMFVGPKTNSLAREASSLEAFSEGQAIMETWSENAAIPSTDSFVKDEVVQMKEEFSDELMDGPPNAEDLVEELAQEVNDGRGLDYILVRNPEVDAYLNENNSSSEPFGNEGIKKEFSEELSDGRVLDDIMVQNPDIDPESENSSNEPLRSEGINQEISQEATEGRKLDDVSIQNSEVVEAEAENEPSIESLHAMDYEFPEDVTDVANDTDSFNETLKNDMNEEFSQEVTDGRELHVSVGNSENCTSNELNSSISPLQNEVTDQADTAFTQYLTGGRVLNGVSVQNSKVFSKNESNSLIKPLHSTEEFSQLDEDFENASNFILETMGSGFMSNSFLDELTGERNSVLVVNTEIEADLAINSSNATVKNEEFSQTLTGERVFYDVSVDDPKVGSFSKNEPNSFKPLQTDGPQGREFGDCLVQNAVVGSDLKNETKILNETIAEVEGFDKENVNRMANSLSTFAKGLINSLNIPLQERQPQNILNSIENYSKDKHIFRNECNNLEYRLTFKRPLNNNDQWPVKKLKLSLEIDHTASVSIDTALSTLPFMINDRSLFEGTTYSGETHEMIRNDNLSIENMLSESTNDSETASVVEHTSEVLVRQVVAPNSVQSIPVSGIIMNCVGTSSAEDVEMNYIQTSEILNQSNVANNEQESLLQSDKDESVSPTLLNEDTAGNSFEDELMLSNSTQRSEESYDESVEKSIGDTVRHFSFANFAGEQKSLPEIVTPEIETSSEDEREVENHFESHSIQAVAVYDGTNSSSVLSSIKRACVLM